jgi:hypothetical protein
MRAFSTLAWGLIIVIADLRFEGVDVVPDPIGWLMVVVALGQLSSRHPALGIGSVAAVVGGIASVPEWFGQGGGPVPVITAVAETLLVFTTCTAIMDLVPAERRTANLVRWWDLGFALVLTPALLASDVPRGLGPFLLAIGLAGLVTVVVFVVLLFRVARQPDRESAGYARPPQHDAGP